METLTQPVEKESGEAIAHVEGCERALGSFGLTIRRAEWLALGCRRGGAFVPVWSAPRMIRTLREAARRVSASKRSIWSVGSELPLPPQSGLLDATKVGEPAYPLSYNGAGEGVPFAPPSIPPHVALPWRSRMTPPPPSPVPARLDA